MLELYWPETKYMCEYINKYQVPSMPLRDYLIDQKMVKVSYQMTTHVYGQKTLTIFWSTS